MATDTKHRSSAEVARDAMAAAGKQVRWSQMDLTEFWRAGLLWRVNEAVLWPLGLALSATREDDGTISALSVLRVDPFDGGILSGATADEASDYLARHAAWVRERLA